MIYFMVFMMVVSAVFSAYQVFVFLLDRNIKVRRYRRFLLEELDVKAHEDIAKGIDPRWRLREFDKVSYDDMMRNPFKKLDDFYPDKTFLK